MPTTRANTKRKDLLDDVAGRARGEFDRKEQTEYPGSPGSVDGSLSSASSTNARNKLPQYVQKQLAIDIERAGGIDECGKAVSISKICNNRIDAEGNYFYGAPTSAFRRKVQKKVERWKGLSRDGQYWYKVLKNFQILSFEELRQAGLVEGLPIEKPKSSPTEKRLQIPAEVYTSPDGKRLSPDKPVSSAEATMSASKGGKAGMAYAFKPKDNHERPIPEDASKFCM